MLYPARVAASGVAVRPCEPERPVEVPSHPLCRFLDVRFQHADVWQLGYADQQIGKTGRHILPVERPVRQSRIICVSET